jgi:hypothetical protein
MSIGLFRTAQTGDGADEAGRVTAAQIKHMVDRFLSWRLPESFTPDAGINFDPVVNKGTPFEHRHQPVGTNLFSATEAEAMVRHMIEGMSHDGL